MKLAKKLRDLEMYATSMINCIKEIREMKGDMMAEEDESHTGDIGSGSVEDDEEGGSLAQNSLKMKLKKYSA